MSAAAHHKTGAQRRKEQASTGCLSARHWAHKLAIVALATGFAVACSSGKPKSPSRGKNQTGLANPPAANSQPAAKPVSDAPVELRQKSVARVLGFTDLGTVALTIYQDTESALYETLAVQAATPSGTAPDPLFYHSPVFIAGIPNLVPLPNGDIDVTIPNMFTQQAVRETVEAELSDVLEAYKIRVEKIGMLPITNVKPTINAFAKDYTEGVELDEEFRNINFVIPGADLPQIVIDAILRGGNKSEAGRAFLSFLSTINIEYSYFVQQYGSQQCQMNIGSDDIRDMYTNQEGCPPGPSPDEVTAGLAWVTEQKGESAADSVNSKLSALLKAGSTVTACAASKEARKLQGAASVSCTKSGSEDFSPIVLDLLKNSIEPTLKSKVVDMRDPKNWEDDIMAAVIQMFGSPERFKSTVDQINSEIQNKNITELDNDYYDKVAWFADTLRNYDTLNQTDSYVDRQGRLVTEDVSQIYNNQIDSNTNSNSKGGSFGANFSGFGFGVGASKGNSDASGGSNYNNVTDYAQNYKASDEFKRDYNEFHNLARAMTLERDTGSEEAVRQTSEYLYNLGYDHAVEKVDGNFQIFPRLNISVRADVSRTESLAQNVKSNELGAIVLETENVPAQLVTKQDAELVLWFKCSGSEDSWTSAKAYLTKYRWWIDDSFWDDLSDAATEKMLQGGCSFLAVKAFYRNAEENIGMIPGVLDISVSGLTEEITVDDTGAPATYFTKSRPIALEIRKEHTEAQPSEGSIQVDAGDKRFTKLNIRQ